MSDMKKTSKFSPSFAPPHTGKEKADIMFRLLTTPTIPMPERYYYQKNNGHIGEKHQAIESELHSKEYHPISKVHQTHSMMQPNKYMHKIQ